MRTFRSALVVLIVVSVIVAAWSNAAGSMGVATIGLYGMLLGALLLCLTFTSRS